jgi:hypothetical protein
VQAIRNRDGHSCLADATWTDQRQQAAPGHFRRLRGDDIVAADDPGDLSGETLRIQALDVRGLRRRLCRRGLDVENKTIAAAGDGGDVAVTAGT